MSTSSMMAAATAAVVASTAAMVAAAMVASTAMVAAAAVVTATVSSAMAALRLGQTGRQSQDRQDQRRSPDRPQQWHLHGAHDVLLGKELI
jgi:hypothetical protein